MIGVIDYKAGNAPSVLNALHTLNIESCLISSANAIQSVTGIILPGVGSAKATMDSLKELKLLQAMERKVLVEKVPFLGICVGLQVLFEYSEEGSTICLGWLKGNVKRFDSRERIPQMGWNQTDFVQTHPLIDGLNTQEYFYFVNSYYVVPEEPGIVMAKTQYGIEFCSMVGYNNIFASQFHIEKSGVVGLQLLKNFALITRSESKC